MKQILDLDQGFEDFYNKAMKTEVSVDSKDRTIEIKHNKKGVSKDQLIENFPDISEDKDPHKEEEDEINF